MSKRESHKIRWLTYLLAAVVFGIIDYYIEVWIRSFSDGLTYAILAYGAWLILVLPITIYEIRASGSRLRTVVAGVATWIVAVFAYYTYTLFRLMFIGQESRMNLHISNSDAPYYWQNIESVFQGEVLGRDSWYLLALVGGVVVSFLVAIIYKIAVKRKEFGGDYRA